MEFARECANDSMTFEAIRACIKASRTEVLGRSEGGQRRYVEAMAAIKSKYANISDYILSTKFGFSEIRRVEDDKIEALHPESNGKHLLVWSSNDFPYNFSSDVKSYIVWKYGKGGSAEITQDEVDNAGIEIQKKLGVQYKEHTWFESAPHLKSIPDLAHIHLIVHVGSRDDMILSQYRDLVLSPSPDGYRKASSILRSGKLVAFPTETVYGLGANALDADAVLSIFQAKGRPMTDPLIVHVASTKDALPLINPTSDTTLKVFESLGRRFWPGPLTIIVRASSIVPPTVTAHTGSVGIRVPSHPIAQKLLHTSGVPIAAPSANRFGHVSPTSCAHVLTDLGEKGVYCLLGESDDEETTCYPYVSKSCCEHGIESTVIKIDPSTQRIMLFRQGAITKPQLEDALRSIDDEEECSQHNFDNWKVEVVKRTVEMHAAATQVGQSNVRRNKSSVDRLPDQHGLEKTEKGVQDQEGTVEGQEAPGQAVTHYAPDVPCMVVSSIFFACADKNKNSDGTISSNSNIKLSLEDLRQHVVVLDFKGSLMSSVMKVRVDETPPFLAYWDLSSSGDYAVAARNLFAALRWAEVQSSARRILISATTSQENPTGDLSENTGDSEGGDLKEGLEDRIFRATSGVSVSLYILPAEEGTEAEDLL